MLKAMVLGIISAGSNAVLANVIAEAGLCGNSRALVLKFFIPNGLSDGTEFLLLFPCMCVRTLFVVLLVCNRAVLSFDLNTGSYGGRALLVFFYLCL